MDKDPRVYFAAERTFLAWVRTGLSMMGFGFVVARFGLFLRELAVRQPGPVRSTGLSLWFGSGLVLLGVAVTLLAARRYARNLRRLDAGEAWEPSTKGIGIALSLVLSLLGLGMVTYLFTVSR